MSLSFQVECEIEATPETVWGVLVDTASWPKWDPFCVEIEGTVALGSKVKAFTKLAPNRGFGVKVTELDAPKKMVWSGGMPLGLFKGVRTYALTKLDEGRTHFSMSEVFSGPMLKLIGRSLPDMTEAFQSFADGLKKQAESR